MWPFSKKISDINRVFFYGQFDITEQLAQFLQEQSSTKIVGYVTNTIQVSAQTRLQVIKPDLLFYFHHIQFDTVRGLVISYMKDDEESKKIATLLFKKLKKVFKGRIISLIEISSATDGFRSIETLQGLKRKVFVNSGNLEEHELFKEVFLKLLEEI
jgi:hypothetical protein